MCCEHLLCASCAQPVADARCSTCRVTRAQMHAVPAVSAGTVVLVGLLLLAVVALMSQRMLG